MQFDQKTVEDWVEENLAKKRLDNDKDFAQLSKLTIVIPSYERPSFLLRQAIYWGHSQANIIIVDGSAAPLSDRARAILGRLPNFGYIHSKDSIFKRLEIASKYIRTPYTVFHSDDEFLIKGSLCKAISILEGNAELVACNGQVMGFNRPVSGQSFSYVHGMYSFSGYSVLEASAQSRLTQAMMTYNAATSYAVLRSEAWIKSWVMQAWSSAHAAEIYQAITIYLLGKLETINDVYMLRSSENRPINIKQIHDRKLTFEGWWFLPSFATERARFVDQLATIANEHANLNKFEAIDIIENAVHTYLAVCEKQKKGAFPRTIKRAFRICISKILRLILPSSIFLILNQSIRKISTLKGKKGRGTVPCVSHNSSEIQAIESLILGFYEVLDKSKGRQ